MTPSTQDALTRQISALRRLESLGFSDDCPGGIAVGGSLVPLQGTGNIGMRISRGIGRRWLPQPWSMISAPVGGANRTRPNGPEDSSEGLRPCGWPDHEFPMDRVCGRCPGARVTPTRRCRIGHHHGHLCGIGHDPGFHHGIHTNRSSEIQITNGQMPMNRSIPTAPNGGRDLSPGLSNAMPWDLTPQHVMRPEGAREDAAAMAGWRQSQTYRSSYSIWYFVRKARNSSWKVLTRWWSRWF